MESFHYRTLNPTAPPTTIPFTYVRELTGYFINNKCKNIQTQRNVEEGSWVETEQVYNTGSVLL